MAVFPVVQGTGFVLHRFPAGHRRMRVTHACEAGRRRARPTQCLYDLHCDLSARALAVTWLWFLLRLGTGAPSK